MGYDKLDQFGMICLPLKEFSMWKDVEKIRLELEKEEEHKDTVKKAGID